MGFKSEKNWFAKRVLQNSAIISQQQPKREYYTPSVFAPGDDPYPSLKFGVCPCAVLMMARTPRRRDAHTKTNPGARSC